MTPASLSLHHIIRPNRNASDTIAPVFMLHGYGSNEEDLFSFASELPEEVFVVSIQAPYSLEPFGYAWYAINFEAPSGKWSDDAQAIASREKIVQFIDEACVAYGLDPNNITLLGFSQGTILSYAVALSYPEKVKRVIALSGYINEALLIEDYETKDHSELSIYASHGQVDQVIPLEWAQRAPGILGNLGIPHVYEEYPVGHGVAPQNFYSFRDWLQDKL